jgi:hypothetical protein
MSKTLREMMEMYMRMTNEQAAYVSNYTKHIKLSNVAYQMAMHKRPIHR